MSARASALTLATSESTSRASMWNADGLQPQTRARCWTARSARRCEVRDEMQPFDWMGIPPSDATLPCRALGRTWLASESSLDLCCANVRCASVRRERHRLGFQRSQTASCGDETFESCIRLVVRSDHRPTTKRFTLRSPRA